MSEENQTVAEQAEAFQRHRSELTKLIVDDDAALIIHAEVGYAYTVGRLDNDEREILIFGYRPELLEVINQAVDMLSNREILAGDWFTPSGLFTDVTGRVKAQLRFVAMGMSDVELVMMPTAVHRYGYLKLLEWGVYVLDLRNPVAEASPAEEPPEEP